jgi:hypothetical protein
MNLCSSPYAAPEMKYFISWYTKPFNTGQRASAFQRTLRTKQRLKSLLLLPVLKVSL